MSGYACVPTLPAWLLVHIPPRPSLSSPHDEVEGQREMLAVQHLPPPRQHHHVLLSLLQDVPSCLPAGPARTVTPTLVGTTCPAPAFCQPPKPLYTPMCTSETNRETKYRGKHEYLLCSSTTVSNGFCSVNLLLLRTCDRFWPHTRRATRRRRPGPAAEAPGGPAPWQPACVTKGGCPLVIIPVTRATRHVMASPFSAPA